MPSSGNKREDTPIETTDENPPFCSTFNAEVPQTQAKAHFRFPPEEEVTLDSKWKPDSRRANNSREQRKRGAWDGDNRTKTDSAKLHEQISEELADLRVSGKAPKVLLTLRRNPGKR